MSAADPRAAMLFEMSQCAHRLGMEFAKAAEQAQGAAKWFEYFKLFDRCFFSVRVGLALEHRLTHAAPVRATPVSDAEALADRDDTAEPERPERDDERDRDREVERASLPILLRTLERVVVDAEALPGPEPADLPTLRELLAHVQSAPASPGAPPGPAARLRARLSGSGATALALKPRPPPLARRATGPP